MDPTDLRSVFHATGGIALHDSRNSGSGRNVSPHCYKNASHCDPINPWTLQARHSGSSPDAQEINSALGSRTVSVLDIVECMAKSNCPDWGVWGDVEVWESSFPNPAGSGYLRLRDLPTEVALGGKVIFLQGALLYINI